MLKKILFLILLPLSAWCQAPTSDSTKLTPNVSTSFNSFYVKGSNASNAQFGWLWGTKWMQLVTGYQWNHFTGASTQGLINNKLSIAGGSNRMLQSIIFDKNGVTSDTLHNGIQFTKNTDYLNMYLHSTIGATPTADYMFRMDFGDNPFDKLYGGLELRHNSGSHGVILDTVWRNMFKVTLGKHQYLGADVISADNVGYGLSYSNSTDTTKGGRLKADTSALSGKYSTLNSTNRFVNTNIFNYGGNQVYIGPGDGGGNLINAQGSIAANYFTVNTGGALTFGAGASYLNNLILGFQNGFAIRTATGNITNLEFSDFSGHTDLLQYDKPSRVLSWKGSQVLTTSDGDAAYIKLTSATPQTVTQRPIFNTGIRSVTDIQVDSLTIGYGSGGVYTNTALGTNVLKYNTTGGANQGVGYRSLYYNTTGIYNTGVGYYALYGNRNGGQNIGIGHGTLINNKSGSDNVAAGNDAAYFNTTSVKTITVTNGGSGYSSTPTITIDAPVDTVAETGGLYPPATATATVVGGVITAITVTSGSYQYTSVPNVVITDGTGTGATATAVLATGARNTAIGSSSLYTNTYGTENVSIGYLAMQLSQAPTATVAIGAFALNANTTGSLNTAGGWASLFSNTTGINNAGWGRNTLRTNTTGSGNTAIGDLAGYNTGLSTPTVSNSTFVGQKAVPTLDGITNAMALGNGAQVGASNTVVIGNTAVTATITRGTVTIPALRPVGVLGGTAGTDSLLTKDATTNLVKKISPTYYAPLVSPSFTTPSLGVATATSINKVTITAPATSATLTLANGSTLATSGAFATTFTSTAPTNVTLPTSGTLSTLAGTETLSNKSFSNPITLAQTSEVDFQNSTFTGSLAQLTLTANRNYFLPDVSGLVLVGNQLKLTASGNGSSTTISIAHGLTGVTSTSFVNAVSRSAAAGGWSYITTDATNINFIYSVAPVSGTNNLSYNVTITR